MRVASETWSVQSWWWKVPSSCSQLQRVFKARDEQRLFVIASLCIATLKQVLCLHVLRPHFSLLSGIMGLIFSLACLLNLIPLWPFKGQMELNTHVITIEGQLLLVVTDGWESSLTKVLTWCHGIPSGEWKAHHSVCSCGWLFSWPVGQSEAHVGRGGETNAFLNPPVLHLPEGERYRLLNLLQGRWLETWPWWCPPPFSETSYWMLDKD